MNYRVRAATIALAFATRLDVGIAGTAPPTEQMYFAAIDNITNVLVAEDQRRNRPHRHLVLVPHRARDLDRADQQVQGRRAGAADWRSRLDLRDRSAHQERVLLARQPGHADPASLQPDLVSRKSITGRCRSSSVRTSSRSDRRTTRRSSWRRPRRRTTRTRPSCSRDDPALVNAFKTKFDRMWNDTTPEPDSLVPSAPYFKNWHDACATEFTGQLRRLSSYATTRIRRSRWSSTRPGSSRTTRLLRPT